MYTLCKESVRILFGLDKNLVKFLQSFSKGSVRSFRTVLRGFCKDSGNDSGGDLAGFQRILVKSSRGSARIPRGFYPASVRSVRIVPSFCEDSARIL